MKSSLAVGAVGLLLLAAFGSLESATTVRNVGVQATGETECWDQNGNAIDCRGTGQDGEYEKGWAIGTYPRFKDNVDGTVKDNLTGLIWLREADCFGLKDWTTALADAKTLASGSCGLTDGSVAGDWRLPNIRELQSLIDHKNFLPALPTGHPFSNVGENPYDYWSSTSRSGFPSWAWTVYVYEGASYYLDKSLAIHVWPVRGGQ